MFLRTLQVKNFKNYTEDEIQFCEHINCLVGLNGSGKTNILDAIHYLSLTKSNFNSVDGQNMRHGQDYFVVNGEISIGEKYHKIHCSLKRGEKKLFTVDALEYDRLSQHLGKFPIVMIAPNDDELVRDSSETRRKFFDSIIAQTNRDYLEHLIKYNHHLKQRNALLKSVTDRRRLDQTLLTTYDEPIVSESIWLANVRQDFVKEFEPEFYQNYAEISGEREKVGILYKTKALAEDFESEYHKSREKDLIMQRTNIGVHRDDYQFMVDGQPVKKFGSQGQQKSLLVSLKFAQFEFMKRHLGITPILLLDDIFDKLDDDRIQKMLQIIGSDRFNQIFITDAREERTLTLINDQFEPMRVFRVVDGSVASI